MAKEKEKEKNPNSKQMAKAFQKSLETASSETLRNIINEVCYEMQASQFRKVETKHKVEALMRSKRPQVNNITREAYITLCSFARSCSTGNGAMLGLISKFQKAYNI